MTTRIKRIARFLHEQDFLIVTIALLSISTVGVTFAGAQSFQGVEHTRVTHAIELNVPYGVNVLKTLGSKRLLVEKDGKTLRCETPTIQEFESKSPLRCSDNVVIQRK